MFEHKTFDYLIAEMLDRVPDDVDKREGSIIYDALAPTAMELAEIYSNMDLLYQRTFADSADGDDLEKRVGEAGVERKQASAAIRRGVFTAKNEPFDIPIGSRFSLDDVNYRAVERIIKGEYRMLAETEGSLGNRDYGELIPFENIEGLGSAVLTDVLIPGEDVESDELLYLKYLEHRRDKAFGGNRADYKKRVMAIQGVGGVRLFRAPAGGGTVRAVIIDSEFNVPTPELVEFAQEKVDPLPYSGEGYGTAPIGHEVFIEAVEDVSIVFDATLSLSGVTLGQIQPLAEEAVEAYLAELRYAWAIRDEPIVVRLAQMEARLLQIEGVVDIRDATFNGVSKNITLPVEVPVMEAVTLHE